MMVSEGRYPFNVSHINIHHRHDDDVPPPGSCKMAGKDNMCVYWRKWREDIATDSTATSTFTFHIIFHSSIPPMLMPSY